MAKRSSINILSSTEKYIQSKITAREKKFDTEILAHIATPGMFNEVDHLKYFVQLKKLAAKNNVHPMFIARAGEICRAYQSYPIAMKFLRVYIRLEKGLPLPNYQYDLSSYLETEEEYLYTEQLIKLHLVDAKPGAHKKNLKTQLFRLQHLAAADPEVTEFVQHYMRSALKKRLGGFQSRKKHFTPKGAMSTLKEMKEVFDASGKRFFLDRGTLLGAVRENGFIASDYDIDVGVFSDEVTLQEIIQMFEGTKFVLNQDYEYKVAFTSPSGIQVDFFLSIRENGYIISKGWKSIHTWYFSDFELMEYQFLGQTFYIPDNYEKHLEENYGNWRTAAIFYDLSYNEPCVVHGNTPEAYIYLTNRFCRALTSNWRYYSHEPAKVFKHRYNRDYLEHFPRSVEIDIPMPDTIATAKSSIVILCAFDEITTWHLQLVQSAASLSEKVIVGILGDKMLSAYTQMDARPKQSDADRIRIAEALDSVDFVYLEDGIFKNDLSEVLKHNPKAIIVPEQWSKHLAGLKTHLAREEEQVADIGQVVIDKPCELITYSQSSICLTLDTEGNLTTRDQTEGTPDTVQIQNGISIDGYSEFYYAHNGVVDKVSP